MLANENFKKKVYPHKYSRKSLGNIVDDKFTRGNKMSNTFDCEVVLERFLEFLSLSIFFILVINDK